MGASLDTPATCPLCNELTRDPVTLKCNHRFCQRCIGDLWSVVPNGPYHCPEWRCKTVYHTLPFDHNLIRRKQPSQSPWPSPRSNAGTSKTNEQTTTSSSSLGRPSLSSRLLGKRKASTSVVDVPETKRSNLLPKEKSNNTPRTSLTDESGVETIEEAPVQNPVPSTSTETSGTSESKNKPAKIPQDDPSVLVVERKSEEVINLDQSDSEVDICDAPLPASPKTIPQNHPSPRKPTSTSSPSHATASPKQNESSHASQRPTLFSTHRVAPSDSTNYTNISPRSESNKNKQIPCNYCPKLAYQFAVKTCLVCGASMCTEHLRPHLDQPVFQNHTLVSPIEDTSPWRCQEHQEMNRIYCRQCGLCVCTVCTVIGSHRDHVCISIREAEKELRGNLKEEINQLQEAENQVKHTVSALTQKKEDFEMIFAETHSGVKQQYGAIREALEQEEQMALQCVAQEEKRVLGGLETKLGQLQSSLQSIQRGLHSLEGLADTKGDKQDQAFIMEYGKVAQMASAIGSCAEQFEAPEEVNQAKLQCLQKWTEKRLDNVVITMPGKDRDLYRLLYGTAPVLDEDSAHPKLRLSKDKHTVTYSESQQAYVDHESRFTSFPQVLALTSLDSGRWYWEVKVSVDDGRWKVGVSEGRIERKGQKDTSRLGFNLYSWCLGCDRKKVEAIHNKEATPVNAEKLEKVGIFLDFDEGTLSFFNVTPGGSLVLMHSYKHHFNDPVYPAFSVSKTNISIADLFRP
ncbi:E3 ubiquitin/ISG15 ligase TRIM25 [Periophthalmus magnuspinnatus]|uniref:E3 ubiquitin/ISG15 ligase TRIM25 n=1 Tax=Periophthalmus magnuspinnatus TaxID=409849 RepID=UPI00145B0BC6|nr:E3 ubiquitin/ISG15 ligase TRIM25 [Periophthalmus magnuspinnatus]